MKKKLFLIFALLLLLINSSAFAADMSMVASFMNGRDVKVQDGITIEAIDGYISFYPKGCKNGTIYRYEFSGTALDGSPFVHHAGQLVKKNHYSLAFFPLTDKPGEYGPFTLTLRNDGQVKSWTFNIKVPEKGLDEWTSYGLLNHPEFADPKTYIDLETTGEGCMSIDGSLIVTSPQLESVLSGFEECTGIFVDYEVKSEQENLIIELRDETTNEAISSLNTGLREVGEYQNLLDVPSDLKYNHKYSIWVYNENTATRTIFTIQEEKDTHPEHEVPQNLSVSNQASLANNIQQQEISPESTTTVESNSDTMLVKIRDEGSVNVRQKPNADSKRIGSVAAGSMYPCLEIASNGWFKIELEDGAVGYVSPKMATLVE